jgi:hypothetical protein
MAVKFEIYRDGKRLGAFQPEAAMVMGPESVPIPGEVRFKNGLLAAERIDYHPIGIALLWDMGDAGAYHLETTRLPHRETPYNLNVELARHRLMKLMQKWEDWNLFDFPRADKFQQAFRDAQMKLAESLGQLSDPPAAAKTADEALEMGLKLSEEVSLFHGELLLNRRKTAGQFGKIIFGCRVDSTVQSQKYKEMVPGQFDYACVPMPWRQIQPEETVFINDPVDQWIEEMSRQRVPVIAGPLVRLDESDVPDWLFIWEHDYDTLRQMAYEYVQKLVARYRKGVAVWNVVAGLSANRLFPLSFEQLIELTRLLVVQVKNMLPQARTLVTITQPFGEYHAEHTTTVPPFLYAEMVAQAGIHFEGFGLEIEMGVPTPGSFTRDLFQFSCLLDRFALLGKPVFVTSITAPGRNTPDPGDISEGKFDPAAAGRWHKPWDPEVQADWLEQIYKVILSKPYVETVAWADLADLNQTVPAGGLLDDMFHPKPAMNRLTEMRHRLLTALGRKN